MAISHIIILAAFIGIGIIGMMAIQDAILRCVATWQKHGHTPIMKPMTTPEPCIDAVGKYHTRNLTHSFKMDWHQAA